MAKAMFQISEASLGGEPAGKLVRGRTKNWMEAACDLGRQLPKSYSGARGGEMRTRYAMSNAEKSNGFGLGRNLHD
jgi:hypothetical protein